MDNKYFLSDGVLKDMQSFCDILNEAEEPYVAPGPGAQKKDPDKKPEWQKDLDADTIMSDCDARDCKFWNEGFKGSCMLFNVQISAKAGCMQYRPVEGKK